MAIIHIIRIPPTPEQIAEMLQVFDEFIKLAVDIEREILAGGGSRHEEAVMLIVKAWCFKMAANSKTFGAPIGTPKIRKRDLRL